jgi:ribosomal protein L34E
MLVKCNALCKLSDGTTDASLDVETNEAMCNECGEVLSGVSEYSKLSMKMNGDIIRTKKKRAFVFHCQTCDDHVETMFSNSRLVGKVCPNLGEGCKINVTNHMARAIRDAQLQQEKLKENRDEVLADE